MKKFNYKKWITENKHGKSLNEELDANKIKGLLKNLIDNSEVDSDVRSDLVGIILPSLEKANAPEELVKNLKILSNDFDTTDGVPYSRQPDEVKNAITYLTGDEAQKSVDQIGDIAGGHADALKPGTEKIYTADAFPDGLRDSDFYKKSVKDGWKFITKNSLTPDQEKIAKSLPTKSDGTPLKEMKVTDKDGNDVTSDIIKQLEKSLEKSGYKITKEETKEEDDPREDPDYDMDQHYMDYDLPEGKLKSLAEALGYLNEIDGMEDSDDEDLTFEPEDGVVDEISLDDVEFTFEKLKSFFPKFYQKVKFTRTQPNGEEGPYYSDSISFPKLDDSTMEISDESALEAYKDYMKSRGFGNVKMEFNDEAKNQNSRVFIHSDDFNDERDAFIRGKMKALNR